MTFRAFLITLILVPLVSQAGETLITNKVNYILGDRVLYADSLKIDHNLNCSRSIIKVEYWTYGVQEKTEKLSANSAACRFLKASVAIEKEIGYRPKWTFNKKSSSNIFQGPFVGPFAFTNYDDIMAKSAIYGVSRVCLHLRGKERSGYNIYQLRAEIPKAVDCARFYSSDSDKKKILEIYSHYGL